MPDVFFQRYGKNANLHHSIKDHMKKLLYLLAVSLATVCCSQDDQGITIFQTESLEKVLSTDTGFTDAPDTLRVARGENAVLQFVLTSSDAVSGLEASVAVKGLGNPQLGWVHDVLSLNPTRGADDMLLTPDNRYPDPIFDDIDEAIAPGEHRTIVVDVPVPHSAKPGIHKGKLTINGGGIKAAKTFHIQVYPVDLPEKQSLKVVNWYNGGDLKLLNGGVDVDPHSDRYLELLQILAEAGAANGQNCWLTNERPDPVLNADSTDFVLDFANFDRVLDMFEKYGNMQYFCNSHMGAHAPGVPWDREMFFNIIYVEDKQLKQDFVPASDPRVEPFIQKYYTQIEAHLREKGWLDKCYQHIADEPNPAGTDSQKSWSHIASLVKKYAPGLRTIDASSEIIENQDVSVVCLSDNIETMPPVPEGSERWMYTCCVPKLNFANRFVQLPLLKTRILHWMNYRFNECGYLHWGFNYWIFSLDPLTDVTPQGHPNWPGGDAFIVYPGEGRVYPSIRLWAMRDGIRDYDLLKMVEAKDPEKAMAWCSSVILAGDKYNMDTKHFREVRREILEYLSR